MSQGSIPYSFRGANHLTEGFAMPFHEFDVSIFRARASGRLSGGKGRGVDRNVWTG